MTWNVWWRFGDWPARLGAIRETLTNVGPDICGLQEVWATGDMNLAGMLADDLGLHWAWAPSPLPRRWQQRAGETGVEFGNAVLSRWPIGESAAMVLPAAGYPDEGRTVLYASVDSPDGRIPFFTAQFNSAPGQSAVRCAQAKALARFVASKASGMPFPAIVTGDLNAEPDSDEIRLLGGHKTAPAVPDLVLVDAWRYADETSPGWTWDRRNPHVRATNEPSARIDYVLVGPPVAGRGAVRTVRLTGDRPVRGLWASDHAGVVVDLQAAAAPGADEVLR